MGSYASQLAITYPITCSTTVCPEGLLWAQSCSQCWDTVMDKTDKSPISSRLQPNLAHSKFWKTFVKWINQGSFIIIDIICIILSKSSTENGDNVINQRWLDHDPIFTKVNSILLLPNKEGFIESWNSYSQFFSAPPKPNEHIRVNIIHFTHAGDLRRWYLGWCIFVQSGLPLKTIWLNLRTNSKQVNNWVDPHRFLEACLGIDIYYSGQEIQLVYQDCTVNAKNKYCFYSVFSDKPRDPETMHNRFWASKRPSPFFSVLCLPKAKNLTNHCLVDVKPLVFHQA